MTSQPSDVLAAAASADNLSTTEANRLLYDEIASGYDDSEECVVDERLRARLRRALEQALDAIGQTPAPRVLDACGGSGNASLMLFEMGVPPVTVDVSDRMLMLFAEKATAKGFQPSCESSDIVSFLRDDAGSWNLIVFSSALHHLDDVPGTVDQAIGRLAPGGVMLTVFDPTRVGWLGRRMRRLDYLVHVVVRTPHRLPGLLAARLNPRKGGIDMDMRAIGERAERHSLTGIDDIALAERAQERGCRVLAHHRYFEGRFAATRLLFRLLRQPSSFSLIIQAPRPS